MSIEAKLLTAIKTMAKSSIDSSSIICPLLITSTEVREAPAQINTAVAQPGSGAATPSGPCSTASDDSLQPGPQYLHKSMHQQPHGASTHTGGQSSPAGPVRLAHSKSLPLLEDIDGLTELQQQAADMLADVSSACCEIKCNLPREP